MVFIAKDPFVHQGHNPGLEGICSLSWKVDSMIPEFPKILWAEVPEAIASS